MIRLTLPPDVERHRKEIETWLDAQGEKVSRRALAQAGLVAPHWPEPWGRNAGVLEQLTIDEVLRARKVRMPLNPVGIGWAGPTLLHAGTAEQQERYLPGILDGSELWCQLFSEPDAGSDLARLRTRAVRDGDEWVVTGQKIWNGLAQWAKFGILLARTDPGAPKHHGITYFVCPMDTPGIEVRPIRAMTDDEEFNEVFFDGARIPAENVVGQVDHGWELAKVTLANERVGLSEGRSPWSVGPTVDRLVELARAEGVQDPVLRQRLARVYSEAQILQVLKLRTVVDAIHDRQPGPESSVRKLATDLHGRELFRLVRDLAGAEAMLWHAGPFGAPEAKDRWGHAFLFSPALTIGGGTSEVQRSIIGERVLGLPREPDPDVDLPWSSLV